MAWRCLVYFLFKQVRQLLRIGILSTRKDEQLLNKAFTIPFFKVNYKFIDLYIYQTKSTNKCTMWSLSPLLKSKSWKRQPLISYDLAPICSKWSTFVFKPIIWLFFILFIYKSHIPVFTLSPTFSSAIVTDSPFSRVTLAVDGKQSQPQQKTLSPLCPVRETKALVVHMTL